MADSRGRILIICLMHSKPGELIAATLRKAGGDTVAVCPKCMADGAAIREKLGVELTLENVSSALVETVKASGVQTGKQTAAAQQMGVEPTLDDIRRQHETRRDPIPEPPGPPPEVDRAPS